MLSDALRVHIEGFASAARSRNPLFTMAASGELEPAHLARYLADVRQLVHHTPLHLVRARDAALRRGDAPLAAHFARRLGEEDGHEAWALEDLGRIAPLVSPRQATSGAMRALLGFIESTIDEDPALYLAYILFAEYLTVLLGPAWLALLEERCGIPRAGITVVANHAELDRDHVAAALEEIDALVADPSKLPRMRRVLDEAFVFYEGFCEEVATLATLDTPEVPVERTSTIRVTASLSVA